MNFRNRSGPRSALKSSQYLERKNKEKEERKYPNKKNNNKKWLDYCREHRSKEPFCNMKYKEFLAAIAIKYNDDKNN